MLSLALILLSLSIAAARWLAKPAGRWSKIGRLLAPVQLASARPVLAWKPEFSLLLQLLLLRQLLLLLLLWLRAISLLLLAVEWRRYVARSLAFDWAGRGLTRCIISRLYSLFGVSNCARRDCFN